MGISFSSDTGLLRADLNETGRMSEEFFKTKEDDSQMPVTEEHRDWIFKNLKNYLNVIKNNGKVIGYTFMMPSTLELMNDFTQGRINEAELSEKIKKLNFTDKTPEAIYLCASVVIPEFQRKGLATEAFVKSIKKIIDGSEIKPVLFYWAYSKAGGNLCRNVATLSGLDIRMREVEE